MEDGTAPEKVYRPIYSPNLPLVPGDIAAENSPTQTMSFANIKGRLMVEGFAALQEIQDLEQPQESNPKMRRYSFVGGWTWAGVFSIWP